MTPAPRSEIVVADIGGTHARFALAEVGGDGVQRLGEPVVLGTGDFVSLELAWARFAAGVGRALPRAAAIAFAGPMHGPVLKLTNSTWEVRPDTLARSLGLDRHVLINDFGAVAYAAAHLGPEHFQRLCGPERDVRDAGVVTVVGPGTGLGVALLVRRDGRVQVVETEGGHVDFAPLDEVEAELLARLRRRHGRVSVERVVSGPGLAEIHAVLADATGVPRRAREDAALWTLALSGEDPLAAASLERFCRRLGAFAGDAALMHGADAVVIAGGVGLRIGARLAASGFPEGLRAKGRFEARMAAMPVQLVTHPEPGLYGAACAFVERFG